MEPQRTERRSFANKYTIQGSLPSRSGSKVYRALQADSGRAVVLRKFALPESQIDEFLGRGAKVAHLSSRFLSELVDLGRADEEHAVYTAHAYIEGELLTERLQRKGAMSVPEAASVSVRILKALEALHKREVIHGGLRPSRIVHEKSRHGGWHVKVLASGTLPLTAEHARKDAELTNYCPPEVLQGQAWTHRGDLWSLAVLLYHYTIGSLPFGSTLGAELEQRVLAGDLRTHETFRTGSKGPKLEAWLRACLTPQPALRPDASEALRQLLELFPEQNDPSGAHPTQEHWTGGAMVGKPQQILANPPTRNTTTTSVSRKERKNIQKAQWQAAAFTALCAGILGAAYIWRTHHERQDLLQALEATSRQGQPALQNTPVDVALRASPPPAPSSTLESALGDAAPAATADASNNSASSREPTSVRRTAEPTGTPPSSATVSSTDGGLALGRLSFRIPVPCRLAIDGRDQGRVTGLLIDLSPGTHRLTCDPRSASHPNQDLRFPIASGQTTTIRINDVDQASIVTQ